MNHQVVLVTKPDESTAKTAAFDIGLVPIDSPHTAPMVIGLLIIREVKLNWPLGNLLYFLRDAGISKMFRRWSKSFPINYYWLESLYIHEPHRRHNHATQALDIVLSRLPDYAALAGSMHVTGNVSLEELEHFYRRNNFHILKTTVGNFGDPIIFTFVKNH